MLRCLALEATAAELLCAGNPGEAMGADKPLLAKYANWFNIGHDNFEFILDFGQSHDVGVEPIVHTRIVVGPAYAKLLARLLNDSLGRYEEAFWTISDAEGEER